MRKTTHLLGLLICMVVALNFLPAHAQDDDPDTGKIVITRVIPVLPSAIRFRVRVAALQDEIEQINLRVEQEDGVVETFQRDAPLELFIDWGEETEYEIIWNIRDVPLRPFGEMTYRFEVLTTDGEVSVAEETFVFEHFLEGPEQWQSVSSDALTIYSRGETIDWSNYLDNLAESIALLRENTGYSAPIGLVIYPKATEFCQENEPTEDNPNPEPPLVVVSEEIGFPCDPADMVQLYANSGLTIAYVDQSDFFTQERDVFAAIFDLAYSDLWQGVEVPAWFKEGLRQLYNRTNQGQTIAAVQRANQEERMLPLNQMNTYPDEGADSSLWQAQAYGLTLYLADTYGATVPFEIAQTVSPTASLNAAIEAATGESINRLYAQWVLWLDTPKAIAAAGWNPYLETTPTPQSTRTASPIPPTHTPRPTATITPTPSSTYRGVIVESPFRITLAPPTQIPSITPTPLPPGSLNVSNSTPTPAETDEDSGGLCGTGIGVIMLPVFGIIWSKKRQRKNTKTKIYE
jgi:hypothetical protein